MKFLKKTPQKIRLFAPYTILVLCCVLLCVSCLESSKKEAQTQSPQTTAEMNLQKIAVQIEGMTCEIGCAKTIESRLSKMTGIKTVSVSFEKGLGEVVFDANQTSQTNISENIESLANGNTYKVTAVELFK